MSTTMQPLWLDYQRPAPGRQLPGILLLVGSLVLAGVLIDMSIDLATETASAEQKVAKLRQAAERRRLFASADQAAAASSALAERTAASPSASRWESLFSSLEAAGDETVTLLGLTPGAKEILITGEAKGLPEALDYTQRLQAATVLANAHLTKYEVVRGHPQQPVRFTVLADWREAAR